MKAFKAQPKGVFRPPRAVVQRKTRQQRCSESLELLHFFEHLFQRLWSKTDAYRSAKCAGAYTLPKWQREPMVTRRKAAHRPTYFCKNRGTSHPARSNPGPPAHQRSPLLSGSKHNCLRPQRCTKKTFLRHQLHPPNPLVTCRVCQLA